MEDQQIHVRDLALKFCTLLHFNTKDFSMSFEMALAITVPKNFWHSIIDFFGWLRPKHA